VFVTEGLTGATIPGQLDLLLTANAYYTLRMFKSGVSFPSSNQFIVLVADPPIIANDFAFIGHIGLTGMLVQLVCQDDTLPTPNPVEGVKIRLFDQADSFLTEIDSPASGSLDLVLPGLPTPGQRYVARLFPPAGRIIPAGLTQEFYVLDPLPVGATNVFDFTIVQRVVPVTGDPLMCRLTGYFVDGARRPVKRLNLVFRPREGYPTNIPSGLPFTGEPSVIDNAVVSYEARVQTDDYGYVDVIMPRRGVYDVFIDGLDEPFTNPISNVWIPDAPGALIVDVLYPYIKKVTYGSATISMAAGSSVLVPIEVEMSNLQENVVGHDPLYALLSFAVDDPAVALIEITSDGVLNVKGLAAGVTNLTVSRVVGSYAHRSPPVADIVPLPSIPIVTVT